jgi:hypothetical protein
MMKNNPINPIVAGLASLFVSVHATATAPNIEVIEYVSKGAEHYFMTGSADEKRLLDSYPALYSKTGRGFSAWSSSAVSKPAEAVAVQRFYVPSVASHVFTSRANEIELLRSYPASKFSFGFVDEGVAFFAVAPSEDRCASGMKAIYRAFNNRSDANHRYSNDVKLQATMVSRGFSHENVAFCSHTVSVDSKAELSAGTPRASSEDIKVSGVVSGFVSVSSFMIGTQRVNAANARFDNGAASALLNGLSVSAEGVIVNGVLIATEIKLPRTSAIAIDEIKGFVTAVGSGGAIFVNGIAIDTRNAVLAGGTLAQVTVGTEVELHGSFSGGTFVATQVHIEDGPSGNGRDDGANGDAEIKGTVSGFVSVSNFTVNGQVINAKDAVFEDGSAATLANGATVEVNGRIVDGVLMASRVEFKRPVAVTPREYPNFCVRSGLRVIHGARESSLHRARFARAVDNSMVAC